MKCPLEKKVVEADHGLWVSESVSCIGEECAWWDEVEKGRCAILSLVGNLDLIAVRLMHIEERMKK